MDTATHTLLYRSEAFAEDVLDLVAGRPVAVQAPAGSSPLQRIMRSAPLQRVSDAARVLTHRSEHELDDRCGDSLGEPPELTLSRRGDTQLPRLVGHCRRYLARS